MEVLNSKTSKCGYTLIELLVVLALFAIVLSVGIPSIKVILNIKEKHELIKFKRDIFFARNSAVMENTSYTLYLDMDNNGYKIAKEDKRTSIIKEVKLTNGIIIEDNNFNSSMTFWSTGAPSTGGKIKLRNRKKQKIEITITPATGKVNLYINK